MATFAVQSPTYQPAMRIISAITQASQAVITTTFDHDYISGTIIRLHIPPGFGMFQANNLFGEITVTGDDTFTININTTLFDTFAAPGSFPLNQQKAVCVPIGEINSTFQAAVQNVLPY